MKTMVGIILLCFVLGSVVSVPLPELEQPGTENELGREDVGEVNIPSGDNVADEERGTDDCWHDRDDDKKVQDRQILGPGGRLPCSYYKK